MIQYIKCENKLPEQGVVVKTKVDDSSGIRNEQNLKLVGRLWFHPDGQTYVYYTPTHWTKI